MEEKNNIFDKIIYIEKEFPNQPPENEEGNKEYKWNLIPSYFTNINKKCNKLASQMKYRLWEGDGKAVYLLGVTDDGKSVGLTEIDLYKSLTVLINAANKIKTNVDAIRLYNRGNDYIATVRLSNTKITQLFDKNNENI